MDKSKLYIQMCQEAKEFQKLRGKELWQDGDFYTDDIQKRMNKISAWTDREDMPYSMYHPVWLPRQDQLQEMMFSQENRIWRLHEWFNNWYPIGDKTNSFEQLWLAFVMKEKYNKIWYDEAWRKG